ncbi:unnamed protein product [Rhizophagus irregularis]|nr:unnamed protein product [Rhizophagus irregularis]
MFWKTLGACIKRDACVHINFESLSSFESSDDLKINSFDDFQETFDQSKWKKRIVLLIDEFGKLYEADENVRSSYLETFHGMKSSRNNYAIWSIVTIGTFNILYFKSEKASTVPFNVNEPYENPNFMWNQVQFLYNEFVNNFNFTIDPKIIKDIYNLSNRHGLVCLCGCSIQNNLVKEIVDDKLSFLSWFEYALNPLQKEILEYSTFNKMIDMLNTPLLKSLEPFIPRMPSLLLIFFDLAEGVLIRDETTKNGYKMSSALVDMLVQRRVIPEMAIQFFDKDIISSAFDRSYKIADDLWVASRLMDSGIWHLYSDIVITADRQRIFLELLATATKNDLDEHFERVLKYAKLLSADDIWIVHFTCEDGYAAQKLHWPSNDKINVVHTLLS